MCRDCPFLSVPGKVIGFAISEDALEYIFDMKRITVFYFHKKRTAAMLWEHLSALRTTRKKKAVILAALLIPLIFLVFLIFSHLHA